MSPESDPITYNLSYYHGTQDREMSSEVGFHVGEHFHTRKKQTDCDYAQEQFHVFNQKLLVCTLRHLASMKLQKKMYSCLFQYSKLRNARYDCTDTIYMNAAMVPLGITLINLHIHVWWCNLYDELFTTFMTIDLYCKIASKYQYNHNNFHRANSASQSCRWFMNNLIIRSRA